ncbi:MAG TPA: circularly permuted type 2 ATP-grasp protein [Anaerolineae bacterium]|nr:circularly permuted type 2 ATP-grasp protein [Anaerolineae bacterium]
MLTEAIEYYHSLFNDEVARANDAALSAALQREGLLFGTRPICIVLRPRLVGAAHYAQLQEVCSKVAVAARQVVKFMLSDRPTRDLMAFTSGEDALLALDSGYAEPSASSRLDSFFDNHTGSLQFVEYNAESPAGMAYEDELSTVFLSLPVMQEFGRKYRVTKVPAAPPMVETLLEKFREWGKSNDPRAAIVDWKGLPTHAEFVMFQKYLEAQGVPTVICSPDDLTYSDRTLYADGLPVNLVYKRVLTSEFLQKYGQDHALEHPLGQAYRDGSICLVNSFQAKPLHKKMIFGLLSDPAIMDAAGIDRGVQSALAQHIPWTRRVQSVRTTYQGQEVDLLKFVRDYQNRLLLKPNDEYGGKGITIGWETSAEEWDEALHAALESPFVVQERVHIAYEDYPQCVEGKLHIGRRLVDTDPYLFNTRVQGCLTRLSTVTLLNVTAGGGSTVPTFLIE